MLVDLVGELLPFLLKSDQAFHDLVAPAFEHEAIDGLAHHLEHRDHRARTAEHDLFVHRLVHEFGCVLLNEGENVLVRDEQDHGVDRVLFLVVLAVGEFLHPIAGILDELLARCFGVGGTRLGLEEDQEIVGRELHVHVQQHVLGHMEADVGSTTGFNAALHPVVDALLHARCPEHVFGHAFTPMPSLLG